MSFSVIISTNFSWETVEVRRQWNDLFKVLREKNYKKKKIKKKNKKAENFTSGKSVLQSKKDVRYTKIFEKLR